MCCVVWMKRNRKPRNRVGCMAQKKDEKEGHEARIPFKVFFSCRGLNSQQLISTERRTAGTEPSSPVDGVAWTVRMGREATSKEMEV